MARLDAYVFFDGNCAEAMRFYERALGGKIEMMMTHAESPMKDEVPPGSADRILHASLSVEGGALLASDTMPGQPHEGFKGFSLSIAYPEVERARQVFDALGAGGQVMMPLGETFWVQSFGMVVDRYGMTWMVSGGPGKKMG